MPDPNAIISTVIGIEPPLDRVPAEMLREAIGISVELEGERRVRLDPADRRSAGFAQILDELSKQRLPVYLELDPETSTIRRLRIPHVTRVIALRSIDDGVDVELERSHGRHVLRRSAPDFDQWERKLREALETHAQIILTENDAHEVIDIRDYSPAPGAPPRPFPEEPELPPRVPPWRRWIRQLPRIWRWRWWPWWWFRCMSTTKAHQVFDAMNTASCDPLTVPAPCNPFLYPDDGCFARAHEMCRLMINMGHTPKKVWIHEQPPADLHVDTKNHPDCYVEWNWHVAPTLCVRGPGFFQIQDVVIDPSLFTAPVSKATWKGKQGDPNATLTDTDASPYFFFGNVSTDPNYVETNLDLAYYRLQLQVRAVEYGPPPYLNCP
jgi:Glutaminase